MRQPAIPGKNNIFTAPDAYHGCRQTYYRVKLYHFVSKGLTMLNLLTLISVLHCILQSGGQSADNRQADGESKAFGQVVITEIMANPKDAAGLPDAEYVEIYNRSGEDITAEGWSMGYGEKTYAIPDTVMKSGAYVILTHERHAAEWDAAGVTDRIDMPEFPAIANNEERYFRITDKDGRLLAYDLYSADYIDEDFKRKGGFSIELTDTDMIESGKESHAASCDKRGGTPGEANSVQKVSDEQIRPALTAAYADEDGNIVLTFSHPADRTAATDKSNYDISGRPDFEITAGNALCNTVLISGITLSPETVTTVRTGNLTTPGGISIDMPETIEMTLPRKAQAGEIKMTEIMFKADDDTPEYIEIFNDTEDRLLLDDLWMEAAAADGEFKNASRVTESRLLIDPGSYLCLSGEPDMIMRKWDVPAWRVIETSLPALNNNGGYARITDSSAQVIETAIFSDDSYTAELKDRKGISLERLSPRLDPLDTDSWLPATREKKYGTPAAENSQSASAPSTSKGDRFSLSTDVITPDNDGHNDFATIDYELPEGGYTADIEVFDSNGRMIRRIAEREHLAGTGSFIWNGQDDNGRKASRGIYVIVITADSPAGDIVHEKHAIAIN